MQGTASRPPAGAVAGIELSAFGAVVCLSGLAVLVLVAVYVDQEGALTGDSVRCCGVCLPMIGAYVHERVTGEKFPWPE